MSKYQKGQSGNPNGRPKGIRDKRTHLVSLLEEHAEPLVKKAVEMALEGDTQALRLCIERLIPRAKQEEINLMLDSDSISSPQNITKVGSQILMAVCGGLLVNISA